MSFNGLPFEEKQKWIDWANHLLLHYGEALESHDPEKLAEQVWEANNPEKKEKE